MERFRQSESGVSASFDLKEIASLPDAPPITFLPTEVPMICFIRIAFNQLRTSTHAHEYGRFGIVLSDHFLRHCGLRQVEYYTEVSVLRDRLVHRWNALTRTPGASKDEKQQLERAILTFRKPASLFPSLRALTIKVARNVDNVAVEHLTYDRYPDGYDFTAEKEWRLSFDESAEYLGFEEQDLYMVIVPDEASCRRVEDFFKQEWETMPTIRLFPRDPRSSNVPGGLTAR